MVRKVLLQPSESIRRRFVEDLRSKPFEQIHSRVHERVSTSINQSSLSLSLHFSRLAKTNQSTTGTIIERALSSK